MLPSDVFRVHPAVPPPPISCGDHTESDGCGTSALAVCPLGLERPSSGASLLLAHISARASLSPSGLASQPFLKAAQRTPRGGPGPAGTGGLSSQLLVISVA